MSAHDKAIAAGARAAYATWPQSIDGPTDCTEVARAAVVAFLRECEPSKAMRRGGNVKFDRFDTPSLRALFTVMIRELEADRG